MKESFNRNYKSTSEFSFKKADKLFFENGRVINFEKQKIEETNILIVDGKIAQLGGAVDKDFSGEVIDLTDKIVVPGMLDMHVHFREPGREDKETILSGAAAAVAGGFTGVCTMPNTEPATDNKEIIDFIKNKVKDHLLNIYPIAAITIGREGKSLVEMAELVDAGVVAFSDDGCAVENAQILQRALEYSRMFDVPIIEHCEDKNIAAGGAMNEGFISTKLGIPGIPRIAEEIIVARDIMLAKYTSGKIHIAHVSTADSVELIRRAKAEGVNVTCEATPHHFTLSDDGLGSFDTNLKMSPPLRTKKDVEAIINGLKDGTIDVIATDHAPHTSDEKEVEFNAAPFGILGLETAVGLAVTQLVGRNKFSLIEVFEKLSVNPYKVLGLPVPEIVKGEVANLTIVDPNLPWIVDKNRFKSQSRNTPFHNWKLTGRSEIVINNKLINE